jgi:hypothetical protein
MVRIMPDRGFDLLDEDFNYFALFAAIFGFSCFDIFASKYLNRQSKIKEFLLH